MKKVGSMALCLGLAAALCVQSLAAGTAEIVRAFVCEGTLYTYVSMDVDRPVTKAEAKLGGQTFSASGRLETVRQAGAPITWLLLVDNSTSMPAFRQEAAAFAERLAQSGGEHTRFILATFGDAFSVVREDVPAEELAAALEAIPMDERVTRLHTAIGAALDYFEDLPRERNELRCAAVLSDAVQYDPAGGIPYEELLERVQGSDVMLYSVGFGDDGEALERLGRLAGASGGLHQVIGGDTAPSEAGDALAAHCGGLFVTGFDLAGCTAPAGETPFSVTFAAGGELVCRAEAAVELPELEKVPAQAPAPPQTPPSSGDRSGGAGAPAPDPAERKGPVWLIPAVISAAVPAALALVLLVLRRRKPERDAPPVPEAAVYMRLVVLEGAPVSGPEELELTEPLFIGSGPGCTLVLSAEDGEERHARVFLRGGAVYLEDLQTPGGTAVNGTWLDTPRVLRSGDRITIGRLTFQLKF